MMISNEEKMRIANSSTYMPNSKQLVWHYINSVKGNVP